MIQSISKYTTTPICREIRNSMNIDNNQSGMEKRGFGFKTQLGLYSMAFIFTLNGCAGPAPILGARTIECIPGSLSDKRTITIQREDLVRQGEYKVVVGQFDLTLNIDGKLVASNNNDNDDNQDSVISLGENSFVLTQTGGEASDPTVYTVTLHSELNKNGGPQYILVIEGSCPKQLF